jgi:hypothetical protein
MELNESREVQKRAYTAPRLTVHGTVEKITLEQNKTLGPSDGFLFQGSPIMNLS